MGKARKDNSLTKREKQILALIADGKSASEIAEELGIGSSTVTVYSTKIRLKLDIHNKTELVKYALKHNLIRLEQ